MKARLPIQQRIDLLKLAIDHLKDAHSKAFDAGQCADKALPGFGSQNFFVLRCDINARMENLKHKVRRLEEEVRNG